MRKTLVLAAAALTAGLLTASAQNVYSVNIVGYVNRPIQGNANYSLVANPLNAATNTYDGVLRGALPPGWTVLRWNGSSFVSASRTSFGSGWSPSTAGTNSFGPGEAVFILAPAAAPAVTNTFVGEVMVGSFTNTLPGGVLSLIGNIIADGGSVTNLNFAPPAGSTLLKWKEDGIGGYTSFTRTTFGSTWSPSVPTIDVGQGVFVNPVSTYNWVRVFTNSP
jgi:hypothetical protein